MLLVDSSVWIDYFNGAATLQTDYLYAVMGRREILVGDIILFDPFELHLGLRVLHPPGM